LLATEPNLYLSASAWLDEAVVLGVIGDIAQGTSVAEIGVAEASESGWSRGKVAGIGTLALFYLLSDRLDESRNLLELARAEHFSSASYSLAIAETAARVAIAEGDFAKAREALDDALARRHECEPWYVFTAEHTRLRLLVYQGDHSEAAAHANHCARLAKEAGSATWQNAFRLVRLEALVGGDKFHSSELPLMDQIREWPLGQLGTLYSIVGKALKAEGHVVRGKSTAARAARVLAASGEPAQPSEPLIQSVSEGRSQDQSSSSPTRHDLDGAVALLELSAHPHIMGREAFALIQNTGCVESLALFATAGASRRVVATHGWSEAEALAAVKTVAADDLMAVGVHSNETWQLLARPKPALDDRCTLASIRKLIATAVALAQYRRDEKQRAALWPAEALDDNSESVWASEQASEILTVARRIANAPLPVLLTGETGTGKEMLARAIHRASNRAERPMVPFNCSAVPRDMLESQLFGYRRGAFTGAETSFAGVIRAAAGGTLFLDEIADVPLDVQPKLLRFLEYQEIHPLGESQPIKVDVRIIAATNGNLDQLVAQGRFREDLYYRLNGVHLKLPPLRERREEIPTLLQHYIQRYTDEYKKGRLTLSDESLEYLLLYSWPGNIRQLANEVRRMVALAETDATLTPALLSAEIQASRRTIPASMAVEPEIRLGLDQPLPTAVELLEQTLVRHALERTHGRVEEAAKLLGISRKGLFLKRRRWGLQQAS
jgi:DNA-binding NtrC family response regulator